MTDQNRDKEDVDRFLRDKIDTVPHLEALLIVWKSRPRTWTSEGVAERIFLSRDSAAEILNDLARLGLVANSPDVQDAYFCLEDPNRDMLLARVDSTYQKELIRVSQLIHSKPSAAVRAFARAFRLKKGSD